MNMPRPHLQATPQHTTVLPRYRPHHSPGDGPAPVSALTGGRRVDDLWDKQKPGSSADGVIGAARQRGQVGEGIGAEAQSFRRLRHKSWTGRAAYGTLRIGWGAECKLRFCACALARPCVARAQSRSPRRVAGGCTSDGCQTRRLTTRRGPVARRSGRRSARVRWAGQVSLRWRRSRPSGGGAAVAAGGPRCRRFGRRRRTADDGKRSGRCPCPLLIACAARPAIFAGVLGIDREHEQAGAARDLQLPLPRGAGPGDVAARTNRRGPRRARTRGPAGSCAGGVGGVVVVVVARVVS